VIIGPDEKEESPLNILDADRAQVLVEALPYIQKLAGKTVVVKYGGNAMIDDHLKDAVMSDLVLMQLVGIHVVLVHGGGPEINAMLKKIGKKSEFIKGMRVTDQETIDIVQMVLAGKVNKDLVQLLQRHEGKAIGLCGLDGDLMCAEKKVSEDDLGFVGEITEVKNEVINDAIEKGYIPIISTVAGSQDGQVFNINADIAASHIAASLHAEKLILMTDIRGLLRDKDDEETLIPVVNLSSVPKLQKDGVISGGMIPKIDCCVEAVRQGVKRAHIIDGRVPHSILVELFTDAGIGTMFC
jgi:acetylglutamate kinase